MLRRLGFLLVVGFSAGCAARPQATVERVAIETAKAGIQSCVAGHESALSGGIVAIRAGETICLSMQKDGSSLTPIAVVASPADPTDTIVLRCWQEPGADDVFLSVHNPFSEHVKYRAGMLLPGEQRYRNTSSCPVLSNRMALEHWPDAVVELVLTDFHFVPEFAICN